MAMELMNEHEQGEVVQKWLRDNALSIIGGMALGIGGIVGWMQWQSSKIQHIADASETYAEFASAIEASDQEKIDKLAADLKSEFGDTAYASLAAFHVARSKSRSNDADAAAAELNWASKQAQLPALKDLATLRAARLELDRGDAQKAMDMATSVVANDYQALAAEIKADALVVLGKLEQAHAEYEIALEKMDSSSPQRAVIEMKRDDLAVPKLAEAL